MKKTIWKTVFLIALIASLLLTISMVVLAVIKTAQTDIIGGAGWPTFQFLLSEALRSPIGYIHSAAFLAAAVSFIGWRISKK